MDDPKPTPSPPSESPKPVKAENPISFSFRQLQLKEVYKDEGYNFCIFLVDGNFLVTIKDFEYMHYLTYVFDEIRKLQENQDEYIEIVDTCSPDFVTDEETVTITKITIEKDETVKTEEFQSKNYYIFNLIPSIKLTVIKDDK